MIDILEVILQCFFFKKNSTRCTISAHIFWRLWFISIGRSPRLAFLGQQEHTQFSCSMWVFLQQPFPLLCLCLHSPAAFSGSSVYVGSESPAVRTSSFGKCGLYQPVGRKVWSARVCCVLVALCVYRLLARLFTVPLVHLFHAEELSMVFICGRSSPISGEGEGASERKASQCFPTMPNLLCFYVLS